MWGKASAFHPERGVNLHSPNHPFPKPPFRFLSDMTNVADCVNSSPPLISQKFLDLVEFGNSGKFRKIQGNSVEFSMALSLNLVGIPAGFGATPDFRENLGFGVVSGDLGGQKAFAQ